MAKFYNSDIDIKIIELGGASFRGEDEARKLLMKYNKRVYASVKYTFRFMKGFWDVSENEGLFINSLNQFQLHVEL